jgi:hypothetical protein
MDGDSEMSFMADINESMPTLPRDWDRMDASP